MDWRTVAINDIIIERRRQIASEGWANKHDDLHTEGQMALAAACYARYAATETIHYAALNEALSGAAPALWPWSPEWWKPTTRRRMLVKACALLVAEIERLDRAEAKTSLESNTGGDNA